MLETMMDFLQMCPQLADMDAHADYSGNNFGWTLYDAGEEVEAVYWDGARLKKHSYSLELRCSTATDAERVEASKLMEKVSRWLLEMSDQEILPELGDEKTAQKLECNSGTLGSVDPDGIHGIYNLQLHLSYEERGGELGT